MKAIWKYTFDIEDRFTKEMPSGDLLHVELQNGIPTFWALVDVEAKKVPRKFVVVGTGHTRPDEFWAKLTGVGTFQQGSFVWHLFEEVR